MIKSESLTFIERKLCTDQMASAKEKEKLTVTVFFDVDCYFWILIVMLLNWKQKERVIERK